VMNTAAHCGASSKEKALLRVATPVPRLPFNLGASYRVFCFFPKGS